eukprot:332028-Rhodomonas_salina.1
MVLGPYRPASAPGACDAAMVATALRPIKVHCPPTGAVVCVVRGAGRRGAADHIHQGQRSRGQGEEVCAAICLGVSSYAVNGTGLAYSGTTAYMMSDTELA